MDDKLYLPTLPYWEFGNNWSGSYGKIRFFVTVSEDSMLIEVWNNDICRELAEVCQSAQFEISQSGIDSMKAWLWDQINTLN